MQDETDLTTLEGRRAACEAVARELETRDDPLGQAVATLARIIAAEIGANVM